MSITTTAPREDEYAERWRQAGDTILFGKYAGQEVSADGVEYLIMKEDDVLAIQERSL